MSESKEVVRIRVKKCDGSEKPEYKKMCVDPQITSFSILQSLLIRAFNIKKNFTISYLATDEEDGKDVYLSMLSDWDLDAAIDTSSSPYLCLKVDLKPFDKGLDDWEKNDFQDFSSKQLKGGLNSNSLCSKPSSFSPPQPSTSQQNMDLNLKILTKVPPPDKNYSNAINQFLGKTVFNLSKVMGFKQSEEEDPINLHPQVTSLSLSSSSSSLSSPPFSSFATSTPHSSSHPYLSDIEFRKFQNKIGCLVNENQFRLAVYQGGVEPSLRAVAWRHLLNIYPEGLNGKERINHLENKKKEYYFLRDRWRESRMNKKMSEAEKQVVIAVKKDVLRTDRQHPFYSGSDDNANTISLLNILVTFILSHPSISYCQGMCDLASPLLVVQKNEPLAYICFCSLMKRLKNNFSLDGLLMTEKFCHLSLLLEIYDNKFASHLRHHRLEADLFFCYRWLLLEMKREFPLDEALYVLEIMWSTLPIDHPSSQGISLSENSGISSLNQSDDHIYSYSHPSPSFHKPSFNYLNLKRKLSSLECESNQKEKEEKRFEPKKSPSPEEEKVPNLSDLPSPEEEAVPLFEEYKKAQRQSLQIDQQISNISLTHPQEATHPNKNSNAFSKSSPTNNSESHFDKIKHPNVICDQSHCDNDNVTSKISKKKNEKEEEEEEEEEEGAEKRLLINKDLKTEENENQKKNSVSSLPNPQNFGGGNPFLMFLCLSLLFQHRDYIMEHNLDYNDVAMHYDRMVRKHNARPVVDSAKKLYAGYLKKWARDNREKEGGEGKIQGSPFDLTQNLIIE